MQAELKYRYIGENLSGLQFDVHKFLGNGFQEVIYQHALKVLVELKAIIDLTDVQLAQVLKYLKAYKLEVGLLINFGSKSLTFKRLVFNQ